MANEISKITMSENFFKTKPKEDSGTFLNVKNVEKSLEEISLFNNKPFNKDN